MRKLTPTITQSGLLAVLLQHQRHKISELAWRRGERYGAMSVRHAAPSTSSDTSHAS